jgi:deoxyribonuclease V
VRWPGTEAELDQVQLELATRADEVAPWELMPGSMTIGACFLASGTVDEGRAWAGAVVMRGDAPVATSAVAGELTAPYHAGYLALRHGPLLERAVRGLTVAPDVLLVDATGRDHPRGAGMALHLGAVLGVPTVGVTDRPLLAHTDDPGPERGSTTPLTHAGRTVGFAVRTRTGARPVLAHAAWRTDPSTARDVVLRTSGRARTPEPLRLARRAARVARAQAEGRTPPGWRDASMS